jgi:acetoin utilization protein AcuB
MTPAKTATAPAPALRVSAWMSRALTIVRPATRLSAAMRLMGARRIRHLLVAEDTRRLVGIVTARDLRQAMFAPAAQEQLESLRELLDGMTVGEVMIRAVVTVAPDASIRDAARLMHERRVGALPVVERGRLVGILTETDVLAAFHDLLTRRRR